MSLLSIINCKCPSGVSHEHAPDLNPKKHYPDGCIFCQEKPERFEFSRFCPHYFKPVVSRLTLGQYFASEYIFSEEKYFLPREVRDIIYKYCVTKRNEPIEIKLDEKGINHMMNCSRNCSKYFIKFVQDNACPHHILPRVRKHREYYRFA